MPPSLFGADGRSKSSGRMLDDVQSARKTPTTRPLSRDFSRLTTAASGGTAVTTGKLSNVVVLSESDGESYSVSSFSNTFLDPLIEQQFREAFRDKTHKSRISMMLLCLSLYFGGSLKILIDGYLEYFASLAVSSFLCLLAIWALTFKRFYSATHIIVCGAMVVMTIIGVIIRDAFIMDETGDILFASVPMTFLYIISPTLLFHSLFLPSFISSWTIVILFVGVGVYKDYPSLWKAGESVGAAPFLLVCTPIMCVAFKRMDLHWRKEFLFVRKIELENSRLQKKLGTMDLLAAGKLNVDSETRAYLASNFQGAQAKNTLESMSKSRLRTLTSLDGGSFSGNLRINTIEEASETSEALDEIREMAATHGLDSKVADLVARQLECTKGLHFDCFETEQTTCGKPLYYVANFLFRKRNFLQRFEIPTEMLHNFLTDIESLYNEHTSYHNSIHAADVLMSVDYLVTSFNDLFHSITHQELLALYLTAIMHDVNHPGYNNGFLVTTRDPLAVRYNDRNVLENHHASTGWTLLFKPHADILTNISAKDQQTIRDITIELVLATDMKSHFHLLSSFQELEGELLDFDMASLRLVLLKMAIKLADVAHLLKDLKVTREWTVRINEEFFHQGDEEAKLGHPVSPFMDRENANIPKSQLGFIDFVIKPFVELWCRLSNNPVLVTVLEVNRSYWASLADQGVVGVEHPDNLNSSMKQSARRSVREFINSGPNSPTMNFNTEAELVNPGAVPAAQLKL